MGVPQKEICAGCQTAIEDRFLLRVMENSWHEHCLQCSVCQQPLTTSCFVKDRKLLCKGDYDKLYGARCSGCLQNIPANELVMRALGNVYHLRCFVCVVCGHQLQKGDQFVIKDGHIYCRLDFEKEYAMMQLSPKPDWGCPAFSPKSDDDSGVDENDVDTPKGPKRPRTILTTSQRRKFKASFEVNPKPCRKVREKLAAETGLSVRVVQVWFQNQRAKVKKIQRRQQQDQQGSDSSKKTNGQKSSHKKRNKEDADSEDNSSQNEGSVPALPPADVNQMQCSDGNFSSFDDTNSQGIYTSGSLEENLYDTTSMTMDTSLEPLGDVLINQGSQTANAGGNTGQVVNPIDKLYSMQTSYFNAA